MNDRINDATDFILLRSLDPFKRTWSAKPVPSCGVLKNKTFSISPLYRLLWIYSRTARPATPSETITNLNGTKSGFVFFKSSSFFPLFLCATTFGFVVFANQLFVALLNTELFPTKSSSTAHD